MSPAWCLLLLPKGQKGGMPISQTKCHEAWLRGWPELRHCLASSKSWIPDLPPLWSDPYSSATVGPKAQAGQWSGWALAHPEPSNAWFTAKSWRVDVLALAYVCNPCLHVCVLVYTHTCSCACASHVYTLRAVFPACLYLYT